MCYGEQKVLLFNPSDHRKLVNLSKYSMVWLSSGLASLSVIRVFESVGNLWKLDVELFLELVQPGTQRLDILMQKWSSQLTLFKGIAMFDDVLSKLHTLMT